MKSDRDLLMKRMAKELQKTQDTYEVLTDEEFYNSTHGENRRAKGASASNNIFFHCLIPWKSQNAFAVYFHEGRCDIAVTKDFNDFKSDSILFQRTFKKNRYWSFSISNENDDLLYNDTIQLVRELFEYGIFLHPEYKGHHVIGQGVVDINTPLLPKGIDKKDDDYIVVCGRCENSFWKANRCTFCGQMLKWPSDDQIKDYIKD